MSEIRGINIRYLAQGMIKIPAADLPEGFFSWDKGEQVLWAKEWWEGVSRQALLDGVACLDIENDTWPDCIEIDGDDYPVLAQTLAWEAFNAPNSQMLILTPEKEETHD
ncbi:MAG: hypothetical protein JRI66_10725 [Deltaproteobacteria bacterium]|nr:hypothetical protein [Deltaproteobacteria bacterium]